MKAALMMELARCSLGLWPVVVDPPTGGIQVERPPGVDRRLEFLDLSGHGGGSLDVSAVEPVGQPVPRLTGKLGGIDKRRRT